MKSTIYNYYKPSSIRCIVASRTSVKLCGGILVAMPTAIPSLPFRSRVGILEGRSRYARVGLTVHVTASLVQPGSDNHQILEIVNLSPFSKMQGNIFLHLFLWDFHYLRGASISSLLYKKFLYHNPR